MKAFALYWLRQFRIIVLLGSLLVPQQSAFADRYLNVFYNDLVPYGRWFGHRVYGQVWQPYGISRSWRPYTEGRWIHTAAYGWYWQADEPWGSVPFHYGRWAFDTLMGWLWIPGTVWAPAWVSWQYNQGYYAWAPLPPEIYWQPNSGLSFSYSSINNIPYNYWVVVPQRHFINHHLHQYALPAYQNQTYLNHINNSYSNIAANHHQIINPGVPVSMLDRDQQRRMQTLSLHETESLIARPVKNANGDLQYVKPMQQPMDHAAAERERELALRIMRETKQQQDALANNRNALAPADFVNPAGGVANSPPALNEQSSRDKALFGGASAIVNQTPQQSLDLQREQNLRAMQQQVEQQRQLHVNQESATGISANLQEQERRAQQQIAEQQRQQVLQQMAEQQRQQDIQRQREIEAQQQAAQLPVQQQMLEQQRQQEVLQARQREMELQQQVAQQQAQEQRQQEMQRQREIEVQQQAAQQQMQEQQRQQEAQQAQQQIQERQRQQEQQQAQQQIAEQQRQLEVQRQREVEMQQQAAQQQAQQQMLEQQRMQEQQRQQEMQRQREVEMQQQRQLELQRQPPQQP